MSLYELKQAIESRNEARAREVQVQLQTSAGSGLLVDVIAGALAPIVVEAVFFAQNKHGIYRIGCKPEFNAEYSIISALKHQLSMSPQTSVMDLIFETKLLGRDTLSLQYLFKIFACQETIRIAHPIEHMDDIHPIREKDKASVCTQLVPQLQNPDKILDILLLYQYSFNE